MPLRDKFSTVSASAQRTNVQSFAAVSLGLPRLARGQSAYLLDVVAEPVG